MTDHSRAPQAAGTVPQLSDDHLMQIAEEQIDWIAEKLATSRPAGRLALMSVLVGLRDETERSRRSSGTVVEGFSIGIPSGYHYRVTRTDAPLTFARLPDALVAAGTVPSPPPPHPFTPSSSDSAICATCGGWPTEKDHEDQSARVAPLTAGADGQDLPRSDTGVQSPLTEERRDAVLKELDSYRTAIRDAFDEGFALSKLGGPIERAWERSESRQTDWFFAHTRMSVGAVTRREQQTANAVARTAGSDPEPTPRAEKSSGHPAVSAAPPPAEETTVLQAVLDAITGTLNPHTQIADHPNVKFAQLERLKWLKWLTRANVATPAVSTPDGPLHICQQPGFDPRLHRCLGCHP